MKRMSMRLKITLWFTAALTVVVCFTYFVVLAVSNQILQKTVRDNLIETVENNYNEIKFYTDPLEADPDKDASRLLKFGDGFLEVDNDFLDEVNEVYTALYDADGSLVYGENPVPGIMSSLAFSESAVQRDKINGSFYYTFDRELDIEGLEGLWMRGVVSETQGTAQISTVARIFLIILPALVLISSVGGYLLMKRMLRPIRKISETANRIGRENDLKQRIELDGGDDELHQLADTFNEMFEKLDHAFEAQRRFISDASHELRTPVSVITAQCEFSLEKRRSPEEYEEGFRVVRRQGRKLSKLIGDMLDFTRLEGGADRYPPETVDLTELVSSICSDMALIRERDIALRCEAQPDIAFTGNRELLSRLVMNLISNAYRYGKDGGHIFVSLTQTEEGIRLRVADDGIGIVKEDQEKIFQRFYQADRSHSGAGIGLGLSMADEIARFHGGKISVESEPQKGSVFTVIFSK